MHRQLHVPGTDSSRLNALLLYLHFCITTVITYGSLSVFLESPSGGYQSIFHYGRIESISLCMFVGHRFQHMLFSLKQEI